MSRYLTLETRMAHPMTFTEFRAYLTKPKGTPKGGVIILQEIFGLNQHVREVCEQYAAAGFVAIAPAFFDHFEKAVELKYDNRGIVTGREFLPKLGWDLPLADIEICARELQKILPAGHSNLAAIGYCWGGSLAWLSATRLPEGLLACAVNYYGRHTFEFLDEKNRCPVLCHFGETDGSIPLENVRKLEEKHPYLPVHIYKAGHGFNCHHRADYNVEEAKLAFERTLDFLERHCV